MILLGGNVVAFFKQVRVSTEGQIINSVFLKRAV